MSPPELAASLRFSSVDAPLSGLLLVLWLLDDSRDFFSELAPNSAILLSPGRDLERDGLAT